MDSEFDYESGYARVKTHGGLWGIIDEYGYEVYKPVFREIWAFVGKGRRDTKAVYPDGTTTQLLLQEEDDRYDDYDDDDYSYSVSNNEYYNDALDMDQQSQDF